ncbi:MAG: hypothetical protein F6K35_34260 [Okeania sp. SIO2H7]|nr:hypothetical protein [Okeania sp. SIO2H7]
MSPLYNFNFFVFGAIALLTGRDWCDRVASACCHCEAAIKLVNLLVRPLN